MRLKTLEDENFTNFKDVTMTIGTISCNGKCCIEADIPICVCLNDSWRAAPVMDIPNVTLCNRYLSNPMTKGIVFAGLEPFEQYEEVKGFINTLRNEMRCNDPVIIYTGYYKDEIQKQVEELSQFENIIIKFGRYIPNMESRYDEVLGVTLASNNQYAERIA